MTCTPTLKNVVNFAVPSGLIFDAPATVPSTLTWTVPVGTKPLPPFTARAIVTGAPNIALAGSAHVVAVGARAQHDKLRRTASRPIRKKTEYRMKEPLREM